MAPRSRLIYNALRHFSCGRIRSFWHKISAQGKTLSHPGLLSLPRTHTDPSAHAAHSTFKIHPDSTAHLPHHGHPVQDHLLSCGLGPPPSSSWLPALLSVKKPRVHCHLNQGHLCFCLYCPTSLHAPPPPPASMLVPTP